MLRICHESLESDTGHHRQGGRNAISTREPDLRIIININVLKALQAALISRFTLENKLKCLLGEMKTRICTEGMKN